MSVQTEMELQDLVAEYKKILAMKINFNCIAGNINYVSKAIKEMPSYEENMSAEEKANIENIITVTEGLVI